MRTAALRMPLVDLLAKTVTCRSHIFQMVHGFCFLSCSKVVQKKARRLQIGTHRCLSCTEDN